MTVIKDTPFVRGAQKLGRRIQTIRDNLKLPVMVDEITTLLLRRMLDRFDKEVDPQGNKWIPLAQSTLERKARGGWGNENILVRTHDMRNAIQRIRGGLGSTFLNTGAGARIGIQNPAIAKYAKFHRKGTAIMPKRQFLGLNALDVKAVDSLLRRKAKQLQAL